jgi:hypothetical protein
MADPRSVGRDHAAQREAILKKHGGRGALAAAIDTARGRAKARAARRPEAPDAEFLKRTRQKLAAAATKRRKKQ